MAAMVGRAWDVFQPILFGLIGAEITISKLNPNTVGEDHTHGFTQTNTHSVMESDSG